MDASGPASRAGDKVTVVPPTVMVADDDPTSRVLVGAALEGHFSRIVEAENGLLAVQALERESFDVAIVDLDMPVMDGFGVIERARARAETRYLPIIVITGRDDVVAIERAFALGATSFLAKPINWNIFRHQVGYVLQVARVERETRTAKERAERIAAFRERGIAALQKEFGKAADAIIRAAAEASEPGQARAIGELGATGVRLRDVLVRLRRASEILTGMLEPEPRRVRAGRIASSAIDRVKAALGAYAAERIEVAAGLGDVEIMCDPPLAAEALASVLENALLFSHGEVSIAVVSAPPDRVRFEVQDRGRGIPEYMLDVGFEAFRPGGPHSDDRLHLGLGIPTAKALVEQQGGYFDLMSEFGRGTEAFLSFPAVPGVHGERKLNGARPVLTASLSEPANLSAT